jgi:hypothetical protein
VHAARLDGENLTLSSMLWNQVEGACANVVLYISREERPFVL